MNRYALWKYVIIAVALVVSIIYTLPNFFGEAPAVQVASARATVKIDTDTLNQVEQVLKQADVPPTYISLENGSIWARFTTPDVQLKAKDAIQHALNPNADDARYIIALNLLSRSPNWLTALNAKPMFLGLDLRGGVHFLLQVDMRALLKTNLESQLSDLRTTLREKNVRYGGISRVGETIEIRANGETQAAIQRILTDQFPDLQVNPAQNVADRMVVALKPASLKRIEDNAIRQNMSTLHNRVNALGVAEPVIQQQGSDRIVVELPGIQDTARAKDILGRTATLEFHMVDDSAAAQAAALGNGPVPFGDEKFLEHDGTPVVVKSEVILSGDSLTDAQPGFDSQTQQPKVDLTVDAKGGRIMRDVSRKNLKKRMAIVLFDNGKGEVLTAPVIQGELGTRFQISGSMTVPEANDLALLLRAGALAAPMQIIEERTIGPSLGAENISKGFHSVAWGFVAIVIFMAIYYHLFGVFSGLALSFNLLLLIAVLSMLQATLTLPGMAAMALTLGIAIDANVLINERVREELREGASPQTAIHEGYQHAWAAILDSNVTSLLAGLALLTFGTGPIRGFAIVHVIGILTSLFSSVFFSRGLVNLWYGRQKKLKAVSIGTVWVPPSKRAGLTSSAH
ncbi:MAG: protein translocase subunit SecD [Burkholderiaceae bacterium]|jgi:preprotein translocase subunit SecD|nr:MAG: protein translocase subunit SecD [Burkholderiaceae bacterium]